MPAPTTADPLVDEDGEWLITDDGERLFTWFDPTVPLQDVQHPLFYTPGAMPPPACSAAGETGIGGVGFGRIAAPNPVMLGGYGPVGSVAAIMSSPYCSGGRISLGVSGNGAPTISKPSLVFRGAAAMRGVLGFSPASLVAAPAGHAKGAQAIGAWGYAFIRRIVGHGLGVVETPTLPVSGFAHTSSKRPQISAQGSVWLSATPSPSRQSFFNIGDGEDLIDSDNQDFITGDPGIGIPGPRSYGFVGVGAVGSGAATLSRIAASAYGIWVSYGAAHPAPVPPPQIAGHGSSSIQAPQVRSPGGWGPKGSGAGAIPRIAAKAYARVMLPGATGFVASFVAGVSAVFAGKHGIGAQGLTAPTRPSISTAGGAGVGGAGASTTGKPSFYGTMFGRVGVNGAAGASVPGITAHVTSATFTLALVHGGSAVFSTKPVAVSAGAWGYAGRGASRLSRVAGSASGQVTVPQNDGFARPRILAPVVMGTADVGYGLPVSFDIPADCNTVSVPVDP
jgi:hypothetical protein